MSIQMIKKSVRRVLEKYPWIIEKKMIFDWKYRLGRPAPPPHVIKQQTIKKYAKKYKTQVFIETGTFLGDMIDAVKNTFTEIHSIELGHELFVNAQKRFSSMNHIQIHEGDSAYVLPQLLEKIHEPVLFWLDGHFSGGITAKGELETPVNKELESILNHQVKNHIILIDDAHCFTGKDDYPTIDWVRAYVLGLRSDACVEVKDNIIRITFVNI